MPRDNISALTNLTTLADEDELIIRDASAPANQKAVTLGELKEYFSGGVVEITAASDAITRQEHLGRVVVLDRAGGIDLTMPEATGSGDKYVFLIKTATTDAYAIASADPANCDFAGTAFGFDGDGEPANGWTDADATSLAFGGTAQATGGSVGDRIELIDIATDLWQVTAWITQGGTEATPFVA